MDQFDLRNAVNAISDVIQNRPLPLRQFDQIYMKAGDMVAQAVFMAKRFDGMKVVFVGDGDSIALCALHLRQSGIISFGPEHILLLDFDERIVGAATRFAEKQGFQDRMKATLYNVFDPLPEGLLHSRDAFYTNPPWGASNDGESVNAFMERGIEAMNEVALGMLVIADDPEIGWTQSVLRKAQRLANEHGFLVGEMVPEQHLYHLDDAPDLKSCACVFRRRHKSDLWPEMSLPMSEERKRNFYGRENPLRFRYVRASLDLNYGRAPESSYTLEPL